ncbi:hypothetical protein OM076_33690 [Solirubrobacter ginsenosidimutans]|uniref:Uncharacterized protein n=1 Tax=Solirubrobacter ginsenosidimutans TaxID=490573 RepID=A0A9X3S335_9ACTN|nr:hypothetical protein [Solirubrobacter ginsenosidimutans]MDA0165270.1 hypothetical protein [Solirubrobacter ginsenosidimutans]
MRRLPLILAAAVALATAAPARAHALDIGPAPAAGELAGDGWQRAFDGRNAPYDGKCAPLAPGLYQPYSTTGEPIACDLPAGARLFIQFGAYCASWEGVRAPWEQRRCAVESDAPIEGLRLSARGRSVEIDRHRFEFVTRWRWVWVPEGEHHGLQTFTAHGHAAIIDGLRDGDVVTLDIGFPDGPFTFTVNVHR